GVAEAGAAGVVLGLSGGIDSALAAALAVRALGPGKVHVLFLPSAVTSAEAGEDAAEVAASLDLPLRTIEIGGLVDAYFGSHEPEADELRRGNFMARARMAVLFDQSRLHRALVLGTSNKTEILLGYSTVFGDNA